MYPNARVYIAGHCCQIQTMNLLDGHLPARVRGLVEEWAELHQKELLDMWQSKDFHQIEPLV